MKSYADTFFHVHRRKDRRTDRKTWRS